MAEIELTDKVKAAIKKAGGDIGIVNVSEKWPSTTGLFHVKIRHFDHFLRYFLFKKGIIKKDESNKETIKYYSAFRNIGAFDGRVLEAFSTLTEEFNKIYETLYGNYAGCTKQKIMHALCTQKKIQELMNLHDDHAYKTLWTNTVVHFANIGKTEKKNPEIFSQVNSDIMEGIELALVSPASVHIVTKPTRLAFCTERYHRSEHDQFEYVLGLVANKQNIGRADFATGYRTRAVPFTNGMKQIYGVKVR